MPSLEPRYWEGAGLNLNFSDAVDYFHELFFQFVKLSLKLIDLVLQVIYLPLNTCHFSPCADANGLLWKSARHFWLFSTG